MSSSSHSCCVNRNLSGNPLQSVDLSSAGSDLTQVFVNDLRKLALRSSRLLILRVFLCTCEPRTLSSCNLSSLAGVAFPQGARSQDFTLYVVALVWHSLR